jgi:3',5'-cyclic AMP phosphodiesterase CpdA
MDSRQSSPDLVFVHLSDIHFRRGYTGDAHDDDRLLRHELELDLRRLRTRLARLDGIIISGDVAFAGKAEEYEYAAAWIETIREVLGCGRDAVMVIPGNHDVDRTVVAPGSEVHTLQQEIRKAGIFPGYDQRLASALRDDSQGSLLLQPLTAYREFARAYSCDISRERPHWERDFALGDGTILRIRGISTPFLSGPDDHELTGKMLYGAAQRTILRQPNVRYMIVGHHPPSWSLEGDIADQAFSTFSSVQVFGHKHEQWITQIGKSVRVIAGAVHPSRNESNWLPRYAAIAVTAVNDTTLGLRIYPRRWTAEEQKFMADFNSEGHDHRDYSVAIEPRQA